MAEKVKTKFDWKDREDAEVLIPCEHCKALDESFCCDDGATASACNHCDYNIILHCLKNSMNKTHPIIIKKGDN